MPRYYFNVREGSDLTRDRHGRDLSDVEAARRAAIRSVREIVRQMFLHGVAMKHRSIEIADETGHVVDVVNSRDVLFKDSRLRSYPGDIAQSAPTNPPHK